MSLLNPTQNALKLRQHKLYNKNVHIAHEYGFHPSLTRHFKRSLVTQSPKMGRFNPKQIENYQQNDFYEFENFNDYLQFSYKKVNFDSFDLFFGGAVVLGVGVIITYEYSDQLIKADDDLRDFGLFG